jgi:hypothetical protein
MHGLRVYIAPASPEPSVEPAEFYSRRADGPYYRWRYQYEHRQWSGSRADGLPSSTLAMAKWKSIPAELQTKLVEHYLD